MPDFDASSPFAPLFAVAWPIAALAFVALWARQLRTRDATSVDVAWAASLAFMAIFCAVAGEGHAARRGLVAILGVVHGARLALHLWRDRMRGRDGEDGRYRKLRETWGDGRFLVFYLGQATSTVVLAIPFALAAGDVRPFPSALDVAAAALWALGVGLETIADAQLRRFKRDPATKGAVCRVGLWSVSRHPNYFGEWLVWCAYAALAIRAPLGALALVAPASILFLIVKVTGIPPTEAQALRSRGDAYRRYQREVPSFFPWFPKRSTP
jgi:steroid 5-alpha reductase family enzyme